MELVVEERNAPFLGKMDFIRDIILKSVKKNIIKKVYLFGSYAYGEPSEDSDVDLCVVVNDDVDKIDTYMKIIDNFIKYHILPCDLIVCHANMFFNAKNPRGIENTIIKEGKILYG